MNDEREIGAWRFKGEVLVHVLKDVNGKPHIFQRLPGLDDVDLGVRLDAEDWSLPLWNLLAEVVEIPLAVPTTTAGGKAA